jgi:hypothetical protein
MKDDKWLMFKNYMHNELGISKEDIRQWIEDAVKQQAETLVKNEFKNFDVHRVVERVISDDKYFGSKTLKRDIAQELSKQILEKIKI